MILSGKIDGIITALKAIASEHRTVNDFSPSGSEKEPSNADELRLRVDPG